MKWRGINTNKGNFEWKEEEIIKFKILEKRRMILSKICYEKIVNEKIRIS